MAKASSIRRACSCCLPCGGGGSGVGRALVPTSGAWLLPGTILFLQTVIPLLIRHTRRQDPEHPVELYHPASVTLLGEVAKTLAAFGFLYREARRQQQQQRQQHGVGGGVRQALADTTRRFTAAVWRLSALLLPAALYFAGNLSAMHALGHLRSYIFTAVMNARIVFAALLSMVMLDKRVSVEQWRAIVIIVCAATVLCLEDAQTADGGFTATEETLGMVIALGTACLSAGGGVLVEKYLNEKPKPPPALVSSASAAPSGAAAGAAGPAGVVGAAATDKDDPLQHRPLLARPADAAIIAASSAAAAPALAAPADPAAARTILLWEQQGALALFSAAFADLYVLLFLPQAVRGSTLLAGWTPATWLVMALQSVQGILVACAIQRYGIVYRLILGTISICLCIVAEAALFFEPVVFREVLSIVLVIVGSSMYHKTSAAAAAINAGAAGGNSNNSSNKAAAVQPVDGVGGCCVHCGRPAAGVMAATGAGMGESDGPPGIGTRLIRRHSPTPAEDTNKARRRWW